MRWREEDQVIGLLIPFHPRTVHFPIALSLAGVALVLAGWLVAGRSRAGQEGGERWQACGRLCLVLGWLGVLAAILTGLVDQSRAPDLPAVRQVLNQHVTLGIALLVALGLAVYWPIRNKRLMAAPLSRWLYVALLILVVVLVALEGWLGGRLVYQYGVGVG